MLELRLFEVFIEMPVLQTKRVIYLLLALFVSANCNASEQYTEISAGLNHGEYDTGQGFDLNRIQLGYGQVHDYYDFSISVPYLFLSDSFGNDSGLGDVIVRAGMSLDNKPFSENKFYGSVAVKVATADDSKGFGTGQNDIGFFLRYNQDLDKFNASFVGGYIVTGDSTSQKYDDIFVYGVGLSRIILPWNFYINLTGHQRILQSGNNPLILTGGFYYQLKPKTFLKLEGYQDLANGSEYGMNLGWVNWF